ncbi:peptidoglycan-binding protein [Curtobacterium aetherium]|uniref:peptidoglycan-binding protein n=1 Tax=Curtobacterium aetherium TaxID=2841594 RepID=UPI003B51E19B
MAVRKGTTIVIAGCIVAALGAGGATWALLGQPAPSTAAESSARHTATSPVTKGDLVERTSFAGTLGYGAPVGVPGVASGTLTWLPTPGQVIERDGQLYAVDERPVRAMHGTTPMWRDLQAGVRGADVRQLNENLAALGYPVIVDDVFGRRTLAAVRQWQEDRGQERTGVLTANDIVFVDGDVRVSTVDGQLGQPASGDVLHVTSTKRVVKASVPARDADRLAVGTAVQVVVNGTGDPLDGSVVDTAPGESEQGETVDVTIAFEPGDRELPSAASAQILAEGQTEHDVLSVPVQALVAGSGREEYTVEVVRKGGTTKRVRVEVGFVADGRAAVTGDVHEGDEVVVPS